jgi:hypothetical protein
VAFIDDLFDGCVFELGGIFRSLHLQFSISVSTSYLSTDLGECQMTYQQIKHWLTIFKAWESARLGNPKLTQTQFALDMKLSPEGKRLYDSSNDLARRGEQKLANATSEQLKMARALMAHATEGVFPCTDPHPWAKGPSKKKRKAGNQG